MLGLKRLSLHAWPRRLVDHLVDGILPPRCLSCGTAIARGGDVCAACWRDLHFIDGPHCACCGLPFDMDLGPLTLCGPCIGGPPRFDRARAALVYDEAAKRLILPFKHADRLDQAPALVRWMTRAGGELLAHADLICAVPMHRQRLLARRYNQAAVLALGIARATGVKAVPDLLQRVRATPSQGGLSATERRANVRGAFSVNPRHRAGLAGKKVVVIDDVYTTGATLEEAARVLKTAGAASVDALAFARVVRPS
jgi:ComF family protein